MILCMALFLSGIGVGAYAQSDQHIGSYKANDMVRRADKMMGDFQRSHEMTQYEQAVQLYKDAEAQLTSDIEKAKADSKNEKLALLYLQSADLQNKFLGPEMTKASQGMPFDTLLFCQKVDKIVDAFNQSATYNVTPNAKGKVKEDPFITVRTKLGISSMLTYYYNCGAFMDAMGKKQESVNYFQKYVDLPRQTSVFTKQEADSIYKANANIYGTARFNLALQNFYLKNWDKAVACCNEALKDTISIHDLYLIKINSLGEKKDSTAWQQAIIEAYNRTGKESFMQNLIYYYVQNNKIVEATAMANKLVVEDPNSKLAWFMKGAIELNVKKDYKAAVESCDKALAIDPNYKDALFNKGTAYINDIYDQTHGGKKFQYIGTNRTITGKQSDGSYQKNKAIYDKERAYVLDYYQKALECMTRYRAIAPNEVKRWAPSLQMVYSAMGEKEKAQEMDNLLDAANNAD